MVQSIRKMAVSQTTRGNKVLIRCLIILLVSTSASQYPRKNSRALLQHLKASMGRVEKSMQSNSDLSLPTLRRKSKNTLMRDFEGSHQDYIGKDETSRKGTLYQNPELELEEAYKNFLRNDLNVKNEKDIKPDFPIRNRASIEHKRKLFCRSGYLVEILPNGTVRGTQDHSSPYTHLTILMYAPQLVIIRTEKPPYRYLVMTEDSKVSAVKKKTIQSVFFYRIGNKKDSSNNNHNYMTFQRAYKRKRNWFLAMKKKDNDKYGTMRKGKNSNPTKRSAQFILVNTLL